MTGIGKMIEWVRYALENRFGYIWGTCGIVWTEAKQKAATRESTVKYGARWIGHIVVDCANLLRWAARKAGCDRVHSGSNLIWDCDLSAKGTLSAGKRTDGKALREGSAVFTKDKSGKRPHVGFYVGGGTVIEAKGTQYGVVTSEITDRKWKEWGELKYFDYGDAPDPGPEPAKHTTLRRGAKGPEVKEMQEKLLKAGEKLPRYGADGDFGAETLAAVKEFQRKNGLKVDGICGPMTWAKLDQY